MPHSSAIPLTTQNDQTTATVWQQIEAVIQQGLAATRERDIDAYMAVIPRGAVVYTADGEPVTRDQLREDILQQWAGITAMVEVHMEIERLTVDGDRAEVVTFQRFRRRTLGRDQRSQHEVLTTRRHREHWQRLAEGWRCLRLTELDGKTFVDGQPHDPDE
jgi:ketosteroid isomerase-like protein